MAGTAVANDERTGRSRRPHRGDRRRVPAVVDVLRLAEGRPRAPLRDGAAGAQRAARARRVQPCALPADRRHRRVRGRARGDRAPSRRARAAGPSSHRSGSASRCSSRARRSLLACGGRAARGAARRSWPRDGRPRGWLSSQRADLAARHGCDRPLHDRGDRSAHGRRRAITRRGGQRDSSQRRVSRRDVSRRRA